MGLRPFTPIVLCTIYISEVLEAVRRQREGLRNPTQTAQELLSTLKSQGLSDSVAQLEKYQELL